MKKAGIVGGIGPASTLDYYDGIIKGVHCLSNSEDNPKIVINSINITEMIGYVSEKETDKLISLLAGAVNELAAAGAEFAVLASNTPHIVFDALQARSSLPLVSIVEETCRAAVRQGCRRVVVLGTLFTMSSGLYTNALNERGIDAFVPDEKEQEAINRIIFPNLESGVVLKEERARLMEISERLIETCKADSVLLGCTELPLAIKPGDLDTYLLNTAQIHIDAIVREILAD